VIRFCAQQPPCELGSSPGTIPAERMGMQGDDLGIFGILWGTAIAFALAAVTMVDSGRKKILAALWGAAVLFLASALAWPWIAEKWPGAKAFAQFVSGSQLAIDLVGLVIFSLLVLDYRFRRAPKKYPFDLVGLNEKVKDLVSRPAIAAYDDNELRRLLKNADDRVTNQAVVTTQLFHANEDLKLKIELLEKNTTRNNGKLHELDREMLFVMDAVMEHLAHALLFNSIPPAPDLLPVTDLSPQNIDAQCKVATTYGETVRQALSDTQWGAAIRNVYHSADGQAELFVRQIPNDERPKDIDPYDFRQYAIERIKSENAAELVRLARLEALGKYRSLLSQLREIYAARKMR
jgi:hypothetical protein